MRESMCINGIYRGYPLEHELKRIPEKTLVMGSLPYNSVLPVR